MKQIKFINLQKYKIISYITSNLVIIRIKHKNYVKEII
jgi:hypothetical protein